MEQALAPILFTDHDKPGAEARPTSIVAPAIRSEAAEQKVRRKRTSDGLPVHSFRSLLQDLATLTKNTVRVGETPVRFEQYARPTQLQARAFQLLDLSYRL